MSDEQITPTPEMENTPRTRTTFSVPEKAGHYVVEALEGLRKLGAILLDEKMVGRITKFAERLTSDLEFVKTLPVEAFTDVLPRGKSAITIGVNDVVVLREAFKTMYGESLAGKPFVVVSIVNEGRVICKGPDGLGFSMAVKHIKLQHDTEATV
jgi:hypothetical protein